MHIESVELLAGEAPLDEALVGRAQDGDRRAFDQLVLRYQRRIVQVVERLVGKADGVDVAQETFVKAYRALNAFRGQSTFYPWLSRIFRARAAIDGMLEPLLK